MKMNVEGKSGIPKKRWLGTIENDMRAVGMCLVDVKSRDKWWLGQRWLTPNR
jgi:hypothetical protein